MQKPQKTNVVALKKTGGYPQANGGEINYLTPTIEFSKHYAWYEFPIGEGQERTLTIDVRSGGYPSVIAELIWLDVDRDLRKDVVKLDLRNFRYENRSGSLAVSTSNVVHPVKKQPTEFRRFDVKVPALGKTLQLRLYVGSQGEFFPHDMSSVLVGTPVLA